ncbi:NAD(P)/FAD-dependent oxidoreductase [Alcaligenes endophyticus]|uniref:FAD-binding oxidoreductase n=1 Tax=Alcaligenes endophyticus TaxID=1929088 RepID=A0ABT8EN51_9BURK|nr:FAD-dependent oxidoreductase [Alcaligenes endophyticus]MCX5591425.1 FAD-dependent oxidoreductase [Alcaligenes endophyticus]MDN4122694.1 FAD-binding oxidoreductase [Alcaligenes endophyticus]
MRVDFLIIGAGMAGSALSFYLAQHAKVLVIDKTPGHVLNARGWACGIARTDGQPQLVRELCALSVPQLEQQGWSQWRPFLYTAAVGQGALLQQRQRLLQLTGEATRLVSAGHLRELLPVLRDDYLEGGLLLDQVLEVNALGMQSWLTEQAQQAGCRFLVDSAVTEAIYNAGRWHVRLANGMSLEASVLINAAGAGANDLAELCGVGAKDLVTSEYTHFLFDAEFDGVSRQNAVVAGIDASYTLRTLERHICLTSSLVPYVSTEQAQTMARRAQIDLAYSIYQLESVSRIRARFPVSSWVERLCQAKDGHYVVGWEPNSHPFFWFTAFGGSALHGLLAASELASHLLLQSRPRAALEALSWQAMQPGREIVPAGSWRV